MSRKIEFLTKALAADAAAERQLDAPSRSALRDTAAQWRLLAELETDSPPTRWPANQRQAQDDDH